MKNLYAMVETVSFGVGVDLVGIRCVTAYDDET
jgi:hypothetical protein